MALVLYTWLMAIDLPGWVISGAESARDKARQSRDLSLEERLRASEAVCATAAYMLALNPKRTRVLQWVDPVPESTVAALERLRASAARPWGDSA